MNLDRRPTRSFGRADIEAILAAGRRNRWIDWGEIRFARLARDRMNTSLDLELIDGRRQKFLWRAPDGGIDLLEDAFVRLLPGRWAGPDRSSTTRDIREH